MHSSTFDSLKNSDRSVLAAILKATDDIPEEFPISPRDMMRSDRLDRFRWIDEKEYGPLIHLGNATGYSRTECMWAVRRLRRSELIIVTVTDASKLRHYKLTDQGNEIAHRILQSNGDSE